MTDPLAARVAARFLAKVAGPNLRLPSLRGMPENVQPVFEKLYGDPKYLQLKKKEHEALEALGRAEDSGDMKAAIAADDEYRRIVHEVSRYEQKAGVPR